MKESVTGEKIMSIGSGAVSLTRFQLTQVPDELKREDLLEAKLSENAVVPLDYESDKEQSLGWSHPFSGNPGLRIQELSYGEFTLFGMRADTKKLPGTFFRLHLKNAYEELSLQGEKSQKEKGLAKKKEQIKEKIRSELLKKTLPNIRLTEVAYSFAKQQVWLFSTSHTTVAQFEELFQSTFPGVQYHLLTPGTVGLAVKQKNTLKDQLAHRRDIYPLQLIAER